ncbi:MAG: type II toxin-antitoxin system VapC family toxin [bacterium]|nr:type II toxin-antitoxin system VapC family toxin [bacterium]
MKDLIYLDASFFIATQIKEHIFHKQASVTYQKFANNSTFCFTSLTIDEVLHALSRYLSKPQITEVIESKLLNTQSFLFLNTSLKYIDITEYLNIWENTPLKPRDAMHYFFMEQNNIHKMATFDTDFIKNKKRLGIEIA